MSLFQVREWWGIKCGDNEEFDQDHLIVGNIDNDPNNVDKIVTASLQGIVRIYLPTQSEYKVQDLILESNLQQPILQIALGKFLSNDKSNFLAVLHSRQLCVYCVKAIGGFGNKAQYYELVKKYSHKLDRNAFNFIYGPFGQRQPHSQTQYTSSTIFSDSICVQSLDGKFWVFEQEYLSFSRDWNNFLIPGCIVYAQFNDSIITMTADMKLYSYSYAVLSTSEQQKLNNLALKEEKTDSNSKSFHKNWGLNLCDHAIKIICARFTETLSNITDCDIIVLCEKSLFVISTNGNIKWQKKLDFNPSTMVAYRNTNSSNPNMHNIMIGNFQNSISIYSQCKLIWSARLLFSPIDIRIGSFAGINGLQIMLSDTGYLMIGYLGTDPSKYKLIHIESEENTNWEQIEKDMKFTKETIKLFENDEHKTEAKDFLRLDIKHTGIEWIENGYIINEKYENELICDAMQRVKAFKTILMVTYEGNSEFGLSNIQITIDLSNNKAFICDKPFLRIESMNKSNNNTEFGFELIFYCKKTVIPNSCNCDIYAIYFNENDVIQTNQIIFAVPFELMLYPSPPIKNTKYCITLQISNVANTEINNLMPTQLFSDLLVPKKSENEFDSLLKTPQVLTLIFYCNNYDITLLLSRKGNRIRIQCNNASKYIISIVLKELIQRLKTQISESIGITLKDELPLNDYFETIVNRYNILQQMRYFENSLGKLSNQFTVIQKRLLMRYKNKNPTSLNEMDTLLKLTYHKIISNTNKLEKLTDDFNKISKELCLYTIFVLLLSKVKYKLNETDSNIFHSFLPPITCCIGNEISEGWEEQIETSMVYALTTCLAKSIKDTKISQHTIGKLKDINKLIRHIKIVFDRIDKGQRFTDKPSFCSEEKKNDI